VIAPLPLPSVFSACLLLVLLSLAVFSAMVGVLTDKKALYWVAMAFGVLVIMMGVWQTIVYTTSASILLFVFSAAVVILLMVAMLLRKRALYWIALAFGGLTILWIIWVAITVSHM